MVLGFLLTPPWFRFSSVDKKELQQWSVDVDISFAYHLQIRASKVTSPSPFPRCSHLIYFVINANSGTKVSWKIVRLVNWTKPSLRAYTSNSSHSATHGNSRITCLMCLMRTRMGQSISRSSSAHWVWPAEGDWTRSWNVSIPLKFTSYEYDLTFP